MIYAIVATQTLTVACLVLAVRWGLSYLSDRYRQEQEGTELLLRMFFETEAKKELESKEQLKDLIEQFNKERELLIERIQHPETARGQAAGVGGETGSTIVDEEAEAKDEGLIEEVEEAEEISPTPIRPVGPIQAIGAEDGQ